MNRLAFCTLALALTASLSAKATTSTVSASASETATETGKKEIIKKGFNFGPLPVVGFDSDLGFQYGLCCDIFNYGDGSNYPLYNYKVNVEASTYTKGSSVIRCYGDFKQIIPDGKLFFDVAYFNSSKFGFYGYNGYATDYDPDYILSDPVPTGAGIQPISTTGDKSAFNFMHRRQFRALASIQKQIAGNWNWAVGFAYYNIKTDALDKEKFSDYEGQETLYEAYQNYGLIYDDEANGGNVTQLRAGITYDSRDHDSDPTSGINMEASITATPDLIDNNGYNNLGFTFSGSQFIPLAGKKLTFAYRLLTQVKICGEIPYYFTNNINTMFFRKMYTEGMGGSTSVRGLNRSGVLGDGYAWLNTELRWRIVDFKLINQNWTIAMNPFFDCGQVIQPYRYDWQQDLVGVPGGWSGDDDGLHASAGCGFKLIMNHNMIVSFEAAKAMNENDGQGLWTNIGFNYLF